jgi:hypothetical protein
MLCSALVTNVSASTEIALGADERSLYVNCGISGTNVLIVDRPQLRLLSHSSGKIIVMSVDSSMRLWIKVISNTGVILATTQITTPSTTGITGSIVELDATTVLITCGGAITGTTTLNFYFIKYNINTYTQTAYLTSWSGSGASAIMNIGQLFYYSGAWYCPAYSLSYSSGYLTKMCKFIVATNTPSNLALSGSLGLTLDMGFQDLNNLKMLYLIACKSTPDYYSYDCSTNTFSLLATNPFPNEFPTYPAYANMQTYMGGGIYQSGTYYYVYHTWLFSFLNTGTSPGIRWVKTVHWTGKFNNSITSGTLISQVRKEQISVDSSSSVSAAPGISWGYLHITVGAYSQDIYAYYQDIYGGKYISRDTCHITDITAMSGSFDSIATLKGVDGVDFTYKSYDANIGKNPMFGVSYQEVDNSNSYLYIGESATTVNFTETFSYSPADNPLLTAKTYTLTWTIYKNGIIDYSGDTYKFFYDGLSMKTGILDGSGRAIISIMINIAGPHSFQIKIYDTATGTELFAGLVRNYTVVASVPPTSGPPSGPVLTTYYSDLFIFWLPVAMIVFLPTISLTLAGAKYAGGAGAITGMIFGGAIGMIGGTVVGIIPAYALYLLVILIATGLVMLIVRGSSGGGSAEP